jgi:hypothetical protein
MSVLVMLPKITTELKYARNKKKSNSAAKNKMQYVSELRAQLG